MKKKLLSLLALTLCMASSTWALNQMGSGPYLIGSAADLQAFATLVNSNTANATANAVLTADIDMSTLSSWTAIGDWHADGYGYKGHFDGQGHTIRNFNFTATRNYFGLFGVIPSGCLIENFTIEGTITINGNYGYAGGVAAYAKEKTSTIRNVHSIVNINSTSTANTPRIGGILGGVGEMNSSSVIDRCTYSGTLNANDKGGNYGGIVGYILNNSNVSADITNCLFDGKLQSSVTTNSAQFGGIIGYTRKGIVNVKNCLSLGTFEYEEGNAMNIGQFIGRLTFDSGTSGCTFDNNYYQDRGYNLYGTSSGGAPNGSASVEATDTQFTSGELCVLLNGNADHGTNWYQTLGTDNYPTPNGNSLVYKYDSYNDCALTTPTTNTISYTNTPTFTAHTYTDGICSTCGHANPSYVTKNSAGYYEIDTASKLKWFAAKVNADREMTTNAVLTDDINMSGITSWEPIGNWINSCAYKGHFNGQGHKIENVNFTTFTRGYHGLFGILSTGCLIENFSISGEMTFSVQNAGTIAAYARDATPTIRNVHSSVTIKDSQTNQNRHHAGIVGTVQKGTTAGGTTVIERCTYSGTLSISSTNNNANYGGIVGFVQSDGAAVCNITDCLFDGTLENTAESPGSCSFGGIVGYCSSGTTTITNCLSVGTVSAKAKRFGQFFGIANSTTSSTKIYNSYYQGANANGGDSKTPTPNEVTSVDTELTSGEVAYLLNESISGGTTWYQTIGTDDYPILDNTHSIVYANGTVCPGTDVVQEGTISFSNTEGTVEGSHNYTGGEGFCIYCDAVQPDYMTPTGSYYMIANEKQLKWFAAFVNAGNRSVNAKLTADIDLDGVAVQPIGNASGAYTGEFDGQGNAITNYSHTATTTHNGLFGYIDGSAVVKNFSISGSLTSNQNYTGTIGLAKGSSHIKGIHSSLNIDIQYKGWAGGIVGGADGTVIVEECWFDGTFNTHNYADAKGGIVGYASSPTIKNCLFSGTFTGESNQHYGGILGYVNSNNFGGVQNCLSMGSVTTTNTNHSYVAAIIGNMNTNTNVTGITNNYWLTGSSYAGYAGAKASDASLEAAHEVTTEQLAIGEVAYKLGSAWYQTIGTDTHPVLDNSSKQVYELEVKAAGWASFVPTVSIDALPTGVTAYVGQNTGASLHLEEVTELPADNAFVVKANEGYYYYNGSDATLTLSEDNDLEFSATAFAANGTQYCLAKKNDVVGFYKVNSGIQIPARKAYLVVTNSVKNFYGFEEDDATSLNEELRMKNEELYEGAVYNLAGQRIQKMQKGINIVNGKKVLY